MLVARRGFAIAIAGLIALHAGQSRALGGPDPAFEFAAVVGDSVTLTMNATSLRQAARSGERFTIDHFPLGADTTVDLEVERFTITGPKTRFVVGNLGGDDAPYAFDPDRVTLLRGTVAGEPGSHVFLALSEWGSAGRIEMAGGASFSLQGGPAGDSGLTSLHLTNDRVAQGHGGPPPGVPLCGVRSVPLDTAPAQAAGAVPEVTQQIEIALETDYELFSLFGDLDATGAYMVELWGAVSDIYLRDVNTRVELTFVRLWDTPDDLFNAEDPLFDFVDYWETFEQAVPRDVAQFVSGRRNMPYGGVAFLQSLCTSSAYGLTGYLIGSFSDPSVPSVFGYDVQVTAHELGHNCGAFHTHDYGIDTCDNLLGVAQRGTIMSYCSQTRSGANGNSDLRLHAIPGADMRAHIFTASCIAEDCNGNGVDDADDISNNDSDDVNSNGVPDECEPDCDGNGLPDDLDIQLGNDTDLYGNGIPDGCEADCDGSGTSDYTEIQADMTLDLDRNAVLDSCQDCDGDSVSDFDELEGAHNVWIASEVSSSLAEFHALSGVKTGESTGTALSFPTELIITADRRILVSSSGDDRVVEFDRFGSYVGDVVASGAGGLATPTGMVISPAGTLLVASFGTDEVLEYDATSGAFLGAFVTSGSGGLAFPFGIGIGPNGNLFVTAPNRVLEYDGVTGAPVGDFVSSGDNGGLNAARGILFKLDGNLLVASHITNQILEYDGGTGAFLGQFNHGGTASVLTLDRPWTLRLGPDGHVYASRYNVEVGAGQGGGLFGDDIAGLHINSTRIYIFHIDSGDFVRSYVTGHDTNLSFPTSFDFMPGDATDCNFNQLPDVCDISSGASTDNNSNGRPDECDIPGDFNGDGTVDVTDLLGVLGAWGNPCPQPPAPCPGDFDGDGVVGVTDLLIMLANWSI